MIKINYDEDAEFLTKEILAGLARNGCWEQVGQFGQLLDELEEQVFLNIWQAWGDQGFISPSTQQWLRLRNRSDWAYLPVLFDPSRNFQLNVPLNSLAALSLLFDVAILPQRRFEQARQSMQEVFKKEIAITDEVGDIVFGDEQLRQSEATEREFWGLFDTVLEEFKLGSASDEVPTPSEPFRFLRAEGPLVKFAANKVAWSVVDEMRRERKESAS